MRPLALTLLALASLSALSAEPAKLPYPLWDGQESIAKYAKRTGLDPTKTLDLGDGVRLELVLIPAGKFRRGVPEPEPVDEAAFRDNIQMGQIALTFSGGVLVVMLAFVVIRAIRMKHRPQVSLARLMVLAVVSGTGLLGGLHWYYSERALAAARIEWEAALARFKSSYEYEKPAHEVTLSAPYYLGKFEITQEQYQQIMGSNPSDFKGRNLPVERVSWEDAQEFCKKVSEKTGSAVRLPTDAEWERACQAGTKTAYYTGDSETALDSAGWHFKNSGHKTHPVGEKAPNAWGVHDMHGNAWEWCADWYGDFGAEAVTDPQGPTEGADRVLRGGTWYSNPEFCRSANRNGSVPDYRGNSFGFRVVWLVPKTP